MDDISLHDLKVIRSLAGQVADISALPIQNEKRQLWRKLNSLRPERPMVAIDNICWNEMNVDNELTLQCENDQCRSIETQLRQTIYRWHHLPVDMVVEPFFRMPKSILNSGFGIEVKEQVSIKDPTNGVVSHSYINQFIHDSDLEKIKVPVIEHDVAGTERRMSLVHHLFYGILDVFEQGFDPYLSVWDPISVWMSVQDVLYALVDRHDFMLAMARRIVGGYMSMLDQLEQQSLLCYNQSLIHCTGAFSDDLPAPGFNPAKPRTQDIWMFGLAQLFANVSPDMFEEFEIDVCMPLFERFGLVYYGCCDPLDRKMKQVRKIPNLRKISMSPWVNEEVGASEIRSDYVYSRKPSPSLLAMDEFDDRVIRNDLQRTVDICQAYNCPLELIQKDISTVRYDPRRLWRWAEIAMDVAQG